MAFCGFMDPLNWSFRYYLVEAIDKFGLENGWAPIIKAIDQVTQLLLNCHFPINETQCHVFYLQMLAEFGDFRRFQDPLTPPSQEIKDKIIKMRRSELRHELLLVNNSIRYNNYILKHHGAPIIRSDKMTWKRFESARRDVQHPNLLVHIALEARSLDWYKNLPLSGKGSFGIVDVTIDGVISRCVSGIVSTPMELLRDIIHLYTNLIVGNNSEKEKPYINGMKQYFIRELRKYLENDPSWYRIQKYVEDRDNDEY